MPAIIVSPWIAQRSVYPTPCDHAPVIRTATDIFDLPEHLARHDADTPSLKKQFTATKSSARPEALPTPTDPLAIRSPADSAASDAKLDGLILIAAQLHYALRTYRDGVSATDLNLAINAFDALATLPQLPEADDPAEARAYLAFVGELLEVYRCNQLELLAR